MSLFGDLFSGVSDLITREDDQRKNKHAAENQMFFQERMSNTQYQRAAADLKAAGVNPILAGQWGGASSPAGAMRTATSSPNKTEWGSTAKTMQQTETEKHKTAIAKADALIKNNTIPASELAARTARIALEMLEATGSNNVTTTYKKLQELSKKAGGDAFTWFNNLNNQATKLNGEAAEAWRAIFDQVKNAKTLYQKSQRHKGQLK